MTVMTVMTEIMMENPVYAEYALARRSGLLRSEAEAIFPGMNDLDDLVGLAETAQISANFERETAISRSRWLRESNAAKALRST